MQRKKRSLKGNKTSGSAQERTSGIYVFFPCGHWLGRPGCHALGARIEANLTSLGPFFLKCKLPRPDCDGNTRIPQCMQRSNLYVYETPLLPRWCNLRKKKKVCLARWQLKSPLSTMTSRQHTFPRSRSAPAEFCSRPGENGNHA